MGILTKASSKLWPQLKAWLGRRPQPSSLQEGQLSSLGRKREEEMCQLLEAKQEPSFVSDTFFKKVRGSWVGTQLKGISLFLKKARSWDFYPYLGKTSSPCHLERFALAKSRQKICRSLGTGSAPAVCWHPEPTPEPRGKCPQQRVAHPWLYTGRWGLTATSTCNHTCA